MKRIPFFISIVIIVALSGCSPKVLPPATSQTQSSMEIRERVVTDTVYFDVPVIKEKVVTLDTASVLTNDYAVSTAVVSEGKLTHSLETVPHKIAVPTQTTVSDTIIVEKEAQTIVQEVEKELTAWQSFLITTGKIALVIAGIAAIVFIVAMIIKIKK